jgi:hypothetical protein
MDRAGQQEIRPSYGTNGEDSPHPFHDIPPRPQPISCCENYIILYNIIRFFAIVQRYLSGGKEAACRFADSLFLYSQVETVPLPDFIDG